MNVLVGCVAVPIALGLGMAPTPLSSEAVAQEAGEEIDLNGIWRFDYEVVRLSHDGSAVQAQFVEGAACFDGQVRPYFLQGELSGATLTGSMMVCSQSPRLVQGCPLPSSMYETTFEASVEPRSIAGTRLAQGLYVEEQDGRLSCRPDSQYDEQRPFAGTRSCDDLEQEVERMMRELQALTDELNALGDRISSTPGVGNWPAAGYTGPGADLAQQYREMEAELYENLATLQAAEARLRECLGSGGAEGDACPGQAEMEGMMEELQALTDELNALGDQISSTPGVGNWPEEGYTGPAADLAQRYRDMEAELYEKLEELQAAEADLRACRGGGEDACPDPAEMERMMRELQALTDELNALGDRISATPGVGNWPAEGYTGPGADLAQQYREMEAGLYQQLETLHAAESRLRECRGGGEDPCPGRAEVERMMEELQRLTDRLNALGDQISSTPGVGNWPAEGYTGPAADLAQQYREMEAELYEKLEELQAAEARLRECEEEAVG